MPDMVYVELHERDGLVLLDRVLSRLEVEALHSALTLYLVNNPPTGSEYEAGLL